MRRVKIKIWCWSFTITIWFSLDGADSSEAWVELTENGVTVGASLGDHDRSRYGNVVIPAEIKGSRHKSRGYKACYE